MSKNDACQEILSEHQKRPERAVEDVHLEVQERLRRNCTTRVWQKRFRMSALDGERLPGGRFVPH